MNFNYKAFALQVAAAVIAGVILTKVNKRIEETKA